MARKSINKFDAVRQALSELGGDAKPIALQNLLRERGIEMTTKHISTYKGAILKGKPPGKRSTLAAPESPSVVTHTAPSNGFHEPAKSGASLSEQLSLLKSLSDSLGKEEAKKIIDMF